MTIKPASAFNVNLLIKIIASILVVFSTSVLLAGHNSFGPPSVTGLSTDMTYATATSFILCGLALWALVLNRTLWITITALLIIAIHISSLLFVCCGYSYNLDSLITRLLTPLASGVNQTSPTVAAGCVLIGISLLAASLLRKYTQDYGH